MKKFLALILALFFLTGSSFAYSLQEAGKLTSKDFKSLLGDKIVAPETCAFSEGSGDIFVPVRDNKTRNLEWCIINPFSKKILKKGDCPFKAFHRFAFSPDANTVMATTKYPSGIFRLNVEKGEWVKLYENPSKNKAGWAFLSISPLNFVESYRAYTIMDLWDINHIVTNTAIMSITVEPFLLRKLVSLKELQNFALQKLFQKRPEGWKYNARFIRFGQEQNIVYVLQGLSNRKSTHDYLLHFSPPHNVSLLDQAEGAMIFPLDFVTKPRQVLYGVISPEKSKAVFLDEGKSQALMENVRPVAGAIMDGKLIALVDQSDKTYNIYLGKPGEKFHKVKTYSGQYSLGFTRDGKKLVMIDPYGILYFKVNK